MIIDASALLAILLEEPEIDEFLMLIAEAEVRRISAANWLEAAIRADHSSNPRLGRAFDALVEELAIEIEPVTPEHVRRARQAYREYGRRNHRAALNFGDCMAYALAKATGEPLLIKGGDFSRTDVVPARQAP
jgi:ribonuclease VapC